MPFYNDAEPPVTSMSVESPSTACSQDQIVSSLCKEIEDKDSRLEEVQRKYDETCRSLSELVQDTELQKERINELEQECEKKNAACESTSRLAVSLMREIDCKNEQIFDLKYTCSEMYSDIRKLVDERDYLRRSCIQGPFLLLTYLL